MEKAKEFIEYVVKSIVESPDAVTLETKTDEMGLLFTLHIAQSDMGRVIGKEGATAKALRTLLRVVGMKEKARINLRIAEPEVSTRRESTDYGNY